MGVFSPLDLTIFVVAVVTVMAIGLWAGWKEDTTEDFYLAGKATRWWGVAGSIFGSNISANHLVGMMGVGFSLGFVESHFEITAIAGLLLLCYGFLPVYRKLNVFTLSEYLGRRYNEPCRQIYALIMITWIVVIQMVPGFYIGSRSLNILLLDEAAILPTSQPAGDSSDPGMAVAQRVAEDGDGRKVQIGFRGYAIGILVMAVVAGTYTIIGGLKAVIVTDVIQSVMMIVAGLCVAVLTFSTREIGGWGGMMALDNAAGDAAKMTLYLPSNHAERPWTGMLSGLMILHFYYWGTNQFIVQRALSARSDLEARVGIIVAGFFKLLVPFMSIGGGVAAYYLFAQRMPGMHFDGDTAFPMLMRQVVAPLGCGVVGIVAAGLIGAILSSIDSLLNSGATIVTFDVYQRYLRPGATERELVTLGRVCIAVFVTGAALLSLLIMDPNREEHFLTYVASHTSKLVTGVLVAFALGMFWKRATPWGGFAAMLAGILFSYGGDYVYNQYLGPNTAIAAVFGAKLNFFHSAFVSAIGSVLVHVVVSLSTKPDAEKAALTWTELGGHDSQAVRRSALWIGVSLGFYALLGWATAFGAIAPPAAGLIAAAWTWGLFLILAQKAIRRSSARITFTAMLGQDRTWAGLLAATAVYLMYHYF